MSLLNGTVRRAVIIRMKSDRAVVAPDTRRHLQIFGTDEIFRIMVEAVVDYAIFMLDTNGYVSTWNLGAERIKQYTAAEILGQHFSVFYPPDLKEQDVPRLELAVATEKGRYEAEGWRIRKDGSRFWANVIITPVRDGNHTLIGFTKVTRDLTERRLTEQLALEASARRLSAEKTLAAELRALRHMSGALAHEISNPIAIIHAKASHLRDCAASSQPPSAHEVQTGCDAIVRTADRASRILRNLRGFAREGSRDHMELASIYELVEESVGLHKTRFQRHRIEVRIDLEDGMPPLLCREIQVGQIITNLLNNAFDAVVLPGTAERWISISASVRDGSIYLRVTDSGERMEDETRSYLMEPFFSSRELDLGMGLGLSLSRAIAQDHGGTLTLCQDTQHNCFCLVIPHASESMLEAMEEPPRSLRQA